MSTKARLYLDIDGVVNTDIPDPAWSGATSSTTVAVNDGGYQMRYTIVWAPGLISAIDKLRADFDVELVFLTTWCERNEVIHNLAPKLGGLEGGRALPYVAGGHDGAGLWKPEALLTDVQTNGALPFIWVDDVEVQAYGPVVSRATVGTPSLLLSPRGRTGLTVADVSRMREWLVQLPKLALAS